ncbi:MAG: TIM barrel protein [Clostridia bacterium]|nr:TIM barrel protein [Clostridia bacterium]
MRLGISVSAVSLKSVDRVLEMFPDVTHIQVKIPAQRDERLHLEDNLAAIREKYPYIELSVHAFSNINLAEPIEAVREAHVALAEDAMRLTADIGGSFTVFHAGSLQGRSPAALRTNGINTLCDSVERLLDTVHAIGGEIHLENIYPAPFRSELVRLLDRVSDYRRFDSLLQDDKLKYCFDFGHAMIDDRGLDILDECMDRLGSIHVHENDRINDLHLAPTGLFEWERYFCKLSRFDGVVIAETKLEDIPNAITEISQYIY